MAAQHPERAPTTAELYPGRDTFEFNHGHKSGAPITVLVLLSESLRI